jgi:hypothetical protein
MKKLNFQQSFDKIKINKQYDYIFKYESFWKFYSLNLKNKKGIWQTFQNKVSKITTDDISNLEIDNFLDENPDIEFEIDFFVNTLPEVFFFKFKNKIYCYSTNIFECENENISNIMVRFYFNVDDIINF